MSDKKERAEWLLWDISDSCYWRDAGNGQFDGTDDRKQAARFTFTDAVGWLATINDPVNDPAVAMIPIDRNGTQ